jgi:hypothetical protein|tara:strand:- start:1362 stop:1583 length:222 start_codon:yes stop_codon:yes gene_type:complete
MIEFLILALGLIIAMLGYFMKQLARDVKELERTMTICQGNMPKEYVLKNDYLVSINKIENKLDQIYKILREGN